MKKSSKQSKDLFEALKKKGIDCEKEKWDKHIDLSVDDIKLYIEVDGEYHYTDPKQIVADLHRDDYSWQDGYHTIRIPNDIIDKHLEDIAEAIYKIYKANIKK